MPIPARREEPGNNADTTLGNGRQDHPGQAVIRDRDKHKEAKTEDKAKGDPVKEREEPDPPASEAKVMMTAKTVQARARSAERFQVIVLPEYSMIGFVKRKAAIAGMVKASVPENGR